MRYLTLTASLLLLVGCDSSGMEASALVQVANARLADGSAPRVVSLRNDTGRTVYYFIGDEDDLATVDLDLSGLASSGPSIRAGQTVAVPYEDIAFYDEGDTRGWVYWTTGRGEGKSFRVALQP